MGIIGIMMNIMMNNSNDIHIIHPYYSSLCHAIQAAGRVFVSMQQSDLAGRAHAGGGGTGGDNPVGLASNYPLVGRKCLSWEGGTRTFAFVSGAKNAFCCTTL
eukprot:COSAG06_NODE_146_length_22145_cov_11.714733_21_plen_103_part_00